MFVISVFLIIGLFNGLIAQNPSDRCPKEDGEIPTYFAHSTNCKQFYECNGGIAYLFTCPDILVFNPNLNVCDWPDNVNCNSSPSTTTSTTTTTTPAPTTTSTTTTTTPAPTTTSTTTTTTTTPAPTTTSTTTTTTPAPTTTSTTTTTTTQSPTTPSDEEIAEIICSEDPDAFFLSPHPLDCNKYIACDHGRFTIMSCPPELYFSRSIFVCVQPDQSGCSV